MIRTGNFNPKKQLQQIKIIYFAIVAGIILYLAVVLFVRTGTYFFKVNLTDPMFVGLIFLSLIAFPAGYYYSGKVMRKIGADDSLEKKLQVYKTGLIIRLACCDGIAFFALICLLLTNNTFSLLFFFLAIIALRRFYPTAEKIANEIGVSQSELESF